MCLELWGALKFYLSWLRLIVLPESVNWCLPSVLENSIHCIFTYCPHLFTSFLWFGTLNTYILCFYRSCFTSVFLPYFSISLSIWATFWIMFSDTYFRKLISFSSVCNPLLNHLLSFNFDPFYVFTFVIGSFPNVFGHFIFSHFPHICNPFIYFHKLSKHNLIMLISKFLHTYYTVCCFVGPCSQCLVSLWVYNFWMSSYVFRTLSMAIPCALCGRWDYFLLLLQVFENITN